MLSSSPHRWEKIKVFVPAAQIPLASEHPTFFSITSGSQNPSLSSEAKNRVPFRFDPTKSFEPPTKGYRSPATANSTPKAVSEQYKSPVIVVGNPEPVPRQYKSPVIVVGNPEPVPRQYKSPVIVVGNPEPVPRQYKSPVIVVGNPEPVPRQYKSPVIVVGNPEPVPRQYKSPVIVVGNPEPVPRQYKSPVIVTSTPEITSLPPPPHMLRPTTLTNTLSELTLPPGVFPSYQHVEVLTATVQDGHVTEDTFNPCGTIVSVALHPESEGTKVTGGLSKGNAASPSGDNDTESALGTNTTDKSLPQQGDIMEGTQTSNVVTTAGTEQGCVGDAELKMDLNCSVSETIYSKDKRCNGILSESDFDSEDLRGTLAKKGAERVVLKDTITSSFNWADDAIEQEGENQRFQEPIEHKFEYTLSCGRPTISVEKGSRIAEIITPVRFRQSGGPTTMVLTTVGLGSEIFTSWDTSIVGSYRKHTLSIILEEPLHTRKRIVISKEECHEEKLVTEVTNTDNQLDGGKVHLAEKMDGHLVDKNTNSIKSTIAQRPGQVLASGGTTQRSTVHVPARKPSDTTSEIPTDSTKHREESSLLALLVSLLWLSVVLYPIAP